MCALFSAPDQKPGEASGMWHDRRAGREGPRLLQADRLGEDRAARSTAALQAEDCEPAFLLVLTPVVCCPQLDLRLLRHS